MFLKYFLWCYLLRAEICWSYLVLPSSSHVPQKPSNPQDVGKPLILTPYLKSNKMSEARELSDVKPFLKGVVSNSGYFTVNETFDSNLFFWFFRKTSKDWQKAPLILWLQGGPGCSSMFGLFEENGPLWVTKKGLKRRKYSWTNDYNVIYIDQPVGSGFSFTNSSQGYLRNQEQVADHLYEALSQFFKLYPELKHNELYITGESYAGRYIPAIAFKIHTLKVAGKSNFNLSGLFMIAATTDGICLSRKLSDHCYQIGIIDSKTKDKLKPLERDVEAYIHSSRFKMATYLWEEILSVIQNSTLTSFYDYTKQPPTDDDEYHKFLKSSDTRKRIHVGNVTFFECSDQVYNDFAEDMSKTVVHWVEVLLEHYPVAFVGGQFDVIVAYPLIVDVLKKLSWSGAFEYSMANRTIFYDGKRVAGYSKTAGNLKDILVRLAGHMVPKNQPRVALSLLNKFVNKKL